MILNPSELRNSMPSITTGNSPTRDTNTIFEAYRHMTTKAIEQ